MSTTFQEIRYMYRLVDSWLLHFVCVCLLCCSVEGSLWRYMDTLQGYPRLIHQDWGGLTSVDAAFTYNSGYTNTGEGGGTMTYLFIGAYYFVFSDMMMADGYPKDIGDNWGLPDDLDAAFQWSKNGLLYFIKGAFYRFLLTYESSL